MNILNRAVWMHERGHQVSFFCVKDSLLHQEAVNRLDHVYVVKRNSKGLDINKALKLASIFKHLKVDHVYCTDKRDIAVLAQAKMFSKRKLSLLYHQQMIIGKSKRDAWHTWVYRKIDFWIAPLHYLKEGVGKMTKFPLDRVHVIPLCMDVEKFMNQLPTRLEARAKYQLSPDDFVVGMMGRIDYAKSQLFVMEVLEELRELYPHIKMLMVGNKTEGEWKDYYDQIERSVNRYENKEFQLYPFTKEVGYFYQAADVFVMASKNETYGMVTIEAMLSEKIIVGTNSAGTKELLENETKGYYFNWMDAQSLKDALINVLDDRARAKEKATLASIEAKEKYSHHLEMERVENLLFGNNS